MASFFFTKGAVGRGTLWPEYKNFAQKWPGCFFISYANRGRFLLENGKKIHKFIGTQYVNSGHSGRRACTASLESWPLKLKPLAQGSNALRYICYILLLLSKIRSSYFWSPYLRAQCSCSSRGWKSRILFIHCAVVSIASHVAQWGQNISEGAFCN